MGNTKSSISSSVFLKKKKEKEKRGKTKKKISQAKYSKTALPSLFDIQVYNNDGIQKPQLWSNDKDQCIKISFSFSREIVPLSLLQTHVSCVPANGGERRCYGRCQPWWGSRQTLGHGSFSGHKPLCHQ